MSAIHPVSRAVIARHPLHSFLAAFPTACFTLTLLTDIAYWRSSNLMWKHFSEWLLLAGLIGGVLALAAGLIDYMMRRRMRVSASPWPYFVGSIAVLILAALNSFVHSGDGWTAVVPAGLIISAVTVIVMLVSDWIGRTTAFRVGDQP